MKVSRIENGIVIDHIKAGCALTVLKILRINSHRDVVSMIMNAKSEKYKSKDIVKIENRELEKEELDKIALVSPSAKVNKIIKGSVVEKYSVEIPGSVESVLVCGNPECITNHENINTKFAVESKEPLKIRCHYCESVMDEVKFR